MQPFVSFIEFRLYNATRAGNLVHTENYYLHFHNIVEILLKGLWHIQNRKIIIIETKTKEQAKPIKNKQSRNLLN